MAGSPHPKRKPQSLSRQRRATAFPMRPCRFLWQEEFTEPQANVRSDDEVSETDGEDSVSDRSYSQVKGEGEYAPGDILKYTFRQRKVKVEAFFPDLTAFLIAVQQICRNRERASGKKLFFCVLLDALATDDADDGHTVVRGDFNCTLDPALDCKTTETHCNLHGRS
ncbi:unnamed protein product [Lampetra planeri]